MSAPFELRLMASRRSQPERTAELIRLVFESANGQELLGLLCEAANPIEHFPSSTEHERGNKEVVATLWRHGAARTVARPPTTTKQQSDG